MRNQMIFKDFEIKNNYPAYHAAPRSYPSCKIVYPRAVIALERLFIECFGASVEHAFIHFLRFEVLFHDCLKLSCTAVVTAGKQVDKAGVKFGISVDAGVAFGQ